MFTNLDSISKDAIYCKQRNFESKWMQYLDLICYNKREDNNYGSIGSSNEGLHVG